MKMRLHKTTYIFSVAVAGLVMTACSDMSEDGRFVYIEPAEVSRAVLIEDFTGQRCPNCPTAAEEIERIIEAYGENAVISVGIHSGPTGLGLMTETGNEYYDYWGVTMQPSGIINRATGPTIYTEWATSVYNQISKMTTVSMDISNAYDEAARRLDISVISGNAGDIISGKLQVWLVEDGIVDVQIMPSGEINAEYVHNHVFRAAVNGTWGEDISIGGGLDVTKTYTYDIPEDWKPENVSIVAFVYNGDGVLQVVKSPVIDNLE